MHASVFTELLCIDETTCNIYNKHFLTLKEASMKVRPQVSNDYDPLALVKRQVGHSDGERPKHQNLPSSTRRRYYSSSDEEDAPGPAPGPGKF